MPRSPLPAVETSYPPPPQRGTPLDDASWQEWFNAVWSSSLRDGGTFPTVTIVGTERAARFSTDNIFQDLINLDAGIYSNYTSSNGNIIYGFACNVRRSAGTALAVGAQLNCYLGRGVPQSSGAYALATTAVAEDGVDAPCVGAEFTPAALYNANFSAKVGASSVFKNRGDGQTTVASGLGSNSYNYLSWAYHISSQSRSGTGEFCGWSVGVQFLDECLDTANPRNWSALITYQPGSVVVSGGVLWKCTVGNINQLPAVPSAYWVQHTAVGVVLKAIGIDLSCVPLATLGRMAAGMRLRDTMPIQWDVTGAIGTFFDPNNGRLVLCDNQGTRWLECDVGNGKLYRNGVFLI